MKGYARPVFPQTRRDNPIAEQRVPRPDLDSFNGGVPGFTLSDAIPPGGRARVLYSHEGQNLAGDRGYGTFADLQGWVLRTRQDGV